MVGMDADVVDSCINRRDYREKKKTQKVEML